MFTGIVEGQGQVESIAPTGSAYRFVVDLGALAHGVEKGDSVALDGTCLTAVSVRPPRVEFDVIAETVQRTAFATVRPGDRVNVERSMPASGRFHGHIVAGHVDGTALIVEKRREPLQTWVTVEAARPLLENMIQKGSVALDGISLTLTDVAEKTFSVAVIPHTLQVTTLGAKGVGALVNIEVDCIGKWIRKVLGSYLAGAPAPARESTPAGGVVLPSSESIGLTLDDLRRYGLG
ncbi:riboflavin synthase [bacterium]|nr:riboflavin synthase [bacterium]